MEDIEPETKQCPFCGETIKAKAKKCKFCGKWLNEENKDQSEENSPKTKKCPVCGEDILAIAKKCKHCGEWLEEKDRKNTNNPVLYYVIGIIAITSIIAISLFVYNNSDKNNLEDTLNYIYNWVVEGRVTKSQGTR